ncbi:MAG: hypothetical protein SOR61_09975 [Evtepia sp.]|uniref:hypothetical protein n=1 Tax=Evtepia sp. TaxID=2773933 RepID=UPI002A75A034|nr:hypothetical protein [Evtepia sp.]MDY3015478.1 hypothetical protein [Evtepia sp.]
MNWHLPHYAKQFTLEQLMQAPAGEKLQQAVKLIQSMQEHATALSEKEEAASVTGVKAATVLTLAVLKKIASGKSPSSFCTEDWKELIHAVSESVILRNDQTYSVLVFQLYEKYIRGSAVMISRCTSQKTIESIKKLADELHDKEILFKHEDLTEVDYIEDCLWISLDAMIKLIASAASMFCGQQASEFAQALASCAFEYGRLMLYRKEQTLINQFIASCKGCRSEGNRDTFVY